MKSSPCFVLCFLLLAVSAFGQGQQQWVKRYSLVSSATNQAAAIVLGLDANIVVGGSSASTNGDLDYVAIKYSPSGQQIWLTRYDSPGHGQDRLRGMALDPNGNVLLTGSSQTVKLDPSGNVVWSQPYAGRAIGSDTNGNVYVTGFSELDYATAKLDPNGRNLWTRTFTYITATNLPDVSNLMAVRSDGTVIVSGLETYSQSGNYRTYLIRTIAYSAFGTQLWTDDSYTPGPVTGAQVATANAVSLSGSGRVGVVGNYFLPQWATKVFDPAGTVLWTWYLDEDGTGAFDAFGTSMAWTGDGNLYLAGSKVGDTGDYYLATALIGTNGHKLWLSEYHGMAPGPSQVNAIAVDSAANACVTGYSPGSGSGQDLITLKYSGSNLVWVARYNGPANGDDIATGVVVDNKGGVYVTGYSATTNGGTEFVTIKYLDRPSLGQPQKRGDGNFQFQLNSWVGQTNTVESSSNLTAWSALTSIVVTNVPMPVVDLGASNFASRFYRVRVP